MVTDAITTRPVTPAEIPLTQGKVAVVDAEDLDRLSAIRWYAARPEDAARRYHGPFARTNFNAR